MQEVIKYDSSQTITVRNEMVSAILLDFKARKTDQTVCVIGDLNKASVEVIVVRGNRKEGAKHIFNGYLNDLLRALGSGSTRYSVNITARAEGYLMALGFGGLVKLVGDDYIEIKVKVPKTTFTSLDLNESDCTIETVAGVGIPNGVTIVEAVNYITGETNVDKQLGNSVVKATLIHDTSANYGASTEAKPVNGITLSARGFETTKSENLLLAENYMRLQNNPETALKDMVIYEGLPLNGLKFKARFDKAVGVDAKIMVLRRAMV